MSQSSDFNTGTWSRIAAPGGAAGGSRLFVGKLIDNLARNGAATVTRQAVVVVSEGVEAELQDTDTIDTVYDVGFIAEYESPLVGGLSPALILYAKIDGVLTYVRPACAG